MGKGKNGLVSLFLQVGCEENLKYDNHTLIRLTPTHERQVESAVKFHDPQEGVEVLKTSRGLNDSLDLLVPPTRIAFVQDYAQENDLVFEVKKTHYGRHLEERLPRRRLMNHFNVYGYNSYANILDFLEDVARRHSDIVQLQPLGNSYQGRPVKLVKISKNSNAGNPIIFIDAGIHAREWVAPAMALYIIHRLTNHPDGRRKELEGVDWYILPVVNPDGYEYTRSSKANRLWRKTMSKTNSVCVGVDGNRNYGFKWAVSGVSSDPCNKETYAGPKPFSEPETRMVRNVMVQNAQRMKLYVSLHSYGQYLVYPWGYTGDFLPKEWKKLDKLAKRVSAAVQNAGGSPFKVLSAGKWYAAAGGSDDYAFGAVGVPYSYTMELTNGYEFVFPEVLLRNVLPQFYEGFKAFGAQIRNEFKPKAQFRIYDVSSSSTSDSSED
ncbi:unnamed protein product [Chilo suppressalis]|uniref:Peptidase M14 domain-containing protein n=1 Tax=Chilo suppressalis TaxID=168631 RepID=A0ABN8B0Y0_CHISP|nr:unnamed protein product [Chilo suppressalis]